MTLEHLIAFNLALFAAIASPGPALLMAVHKTLNRGRTAGFSVGCGLGLMAATWTLMALLGLEIVSSMFPWAYTVTKLGGALYLIYLAWGMWTGARKPLQASETPHTLTFRQGLLINLLNPKSVLFSAAVLVIIFPPELGILEKSLIVLNHFAVEIIFYGLLAVFLSTPPVSRQYMRAKFYIDRVAAAVLGALGIRLLTDR